MDAFNSLPGDLNHDERLKRHLRSILHAKIGSNRWINRHNYEHLDYGLAIDFGDYFVSGTTNFLMHPQFKLVVDDDELDEPAADSPMVQPTAQRHRSIPSDALTSCVAPQCVVIPDAACLYVPNRERTPLEREIAGLGHKIVEDNPPLKTSLLYHHEGKPAKPLTLESWVEDVALLQGFSIPILFEAKRRPFKPEMRTRDLRYDAITTSCDKAFQHLLSQASICFYVYQYQQEIILVALVGDYWCYRVVERDHPDLPDAVDASEWLNRYQRDVPEELAGISRNRVRSGGSHARTKVVVNVNQVPLEDLAGEDSDPYGDDPIAVAEVDETYRPWVHPLCAPPFEEEAQLETEWEDLHGSDITSLLMRMGSVASNQRLNYIRRYLRSSDKPWLSLALEKPEEVEYPGTARLQEDENANAASSSKKRKIPKRD
ncbi:unnamed protein product [Somion occarium]|uniref:Uncharacterized protein n=1 Tax=Somion occarium TaxID=3059160 RepID=A0ABP1CUS0_9APHY